VAHAWPVSQFAIIGRRETVCQMVMIFHTLPVSPARLGAPARSAADLYVLVSIIAGALSTWILGIKMRRKIRRDLGRKATDADLTSLETWMKIEDVKRRNNQNKPLG
jgi:hypothetical protein